MNNTKNEKRGLSLPEAKIYLEICVEEAKSKEWASGIQFALSILDPGIKKLEDDWIPTSNLENRPKEHEEVIISIRKDNGYEYVTSANFHTEGTNIFFGGYNIKEVIAWKPMPEPYKGGECDE